MLHGLHSLCLLQHSTTTLGPTPHQKKTWSQESTDIGGAWLGTKLLDGFALHLWPLAKKRPWMVWMAMDYYLLNLQKIAQGHASRSNMTQLSTHQMPSTVLTCLKMSEVCCSLKGESSQYSKQKQSAVLPEMPGNLRTCYQAATDCRNPSPPGYDRNTVLKYLTFQST